MTNRFVKVIDYGMGNTFSVINALGYLGCNAILTNKSDDIISSDFIILPGVGSFREAMHSLILNKTDQAIKKAVNKQGAYILGICLGMQLLGSHSTEDGDTLGLGLIDNQVDIFSHQELGDNRIPHVGYNSITTNNRNGLFLNLPDEPFFYFNHSYRMLIEDFSPNYATCNYGVDFLAAFEYDNICGTQFHPEKSQSNGLMLLKNFLEL